MFCQINALGRPDRQVGKARGLFPAVLNIRIGIPGLMAFGVVRKAKTHCSESGKGREPYGNEDKSRLFQQKPKTTTQILQQGLHIFLHGAARLYHHGWVYIHK